MRFLVFACCLLFICAASAKHHFRHAPPPKAPTPHAVGSDLGNHGHEEVEGTFASAWLNGGFSCLNAGDDLPASDNKFAVTLRTNGSVQIINLANARSFYRSIWDGRAGMSRTDLHLCLMADGNLVVHTGSDSSIQGNWIWQSGWHGPTNTNYWAFFNYQTATQPRFMVMNTAAQWVWQDDVGGRPWCMMSGGYNIPPSTCIWSATLKYQLCAASDGMPWINEVSTGTKVWKPPTTTVATGDSSRYLVQLANGNLVTQVNFASFPTTILYQSYTDWGGSQDVWYSCIDDTGYLTIGNADSSKILYASTDDSGALRSNAKNSVVRGSSGPLLTSANKQYSLMMSLYGYMYLQAGTKTIWTSNKGINTAYYSGYLQLLDTGVLTLVGSNIGVPTVTLWSSPTSGVGKGPFKFKVFNNGNMAIIDSTFTVTWMCCMDTPLPPQLTMSELEAMPGFEEAEEIAPKHHSSADKHHGKHKKHNSKSHGHHKTVRDH